MKSSSTERQEEKILAVLNANTSARFGMRVKMPGVESVQILELLADNDPRVLALYEDADDDEQQVPEERHVMVKLRRTDGPDSTMAFRMAELITWGEVSERARFEREQERARRQLEIEAKREEFEAKRIESEWKDLAAIAAVEAKAPPPPVVTPHTYDGRPVIEYNGSKFIGINMIDAQLIVERRNDRLIETLNDFARDRPQRTGTHLYRVVSKVAGEVHARAKTNQKARIIVATAYSDAGYGTVRDGLADIVSVHKVQDDGRPIVKTSKGPEGLCERVPT